MLDEDEVIQAASTLWSQHRNELVMHDRIYRYVIGEAGRPEVPEGSNDEIKEIARIAVKNVLALVRDAFAQNLSVVGFRPPTEAENDGEVWRLWQEQRLDARQAEAHRAAITYGTSYAVIEREAVRIRSPRQLFAAYVDPHLDEWPVYSLETWVDTSGTHAVRRGLLMHGEWAYPLELGTIVSLVKGDPRASSTTQPVIRVVVDEETAPYLHGSPQPPVVRFINNRDAEDLVIGEIEPLIPNQRAINAVNFDRLTVARFGAFPQRYAIGWEPGSKSELVTVAMSQLMAFGDEDVKVGSFAAASVEPYNSILSEMLAHVALTAQVPIGAVTGNISNLSADALAMAEAPHQRKLAEKRESFGESWEQVLRTFAALHDIEVDASAEVVWRDTEARSFAQMVDGMVKLTTAGVPMDALLEDIPGWGQQRVDATRAAMRRAAGRGVLDTLRDQAATAGSASPEPPEPAGPSAVEQATALKVKLEGLGVAIRAGVNPEDAARLLDLDGLTFTGAVPTSLRLPADEAEDLEQA